MASMGRIYASPQQSTTGSNLGCISYPCLKEWSLKYSQHGHFTKILRYFQTWVNMRDQIMSCLLDLVDRTHLGFLVSLKNPTWTSKLSNGSCWINCIYMILHVYTYTKYHWIYIELHAHVPGSKLDFKEHDSIFRPNIWECMRGREMAHHGHVWTCTYNYGTAMSRLKNMSWSTTAIWGGSSKPAIHFWCTKILA
jgi:hypothetical protein